MNRIDQLRGASAVLALTAAACIGDIPSSLDVRYVDADPQSGLFDELVIRDGYGESHDVREQCDRELDRSELRAIVEAHEEVESVPRDVTPGATCTDCRSYTLRIDISGREPLDTAWRDVPDQQVAGSAFLDLVMVLDQVWSRVRAEGICEDAPFGL
jgi:hypothetical protein